MFGLRLTRIFASRWHALWWSATILLLAWRVVPAPEAPPVDGNSARAPGHDATAAANPWGLDAPVADGQR